MLCRSAASCSDGSPPSPRTRLPTTLLSPCMPQVTAHHISSLQGVPALGFHKQIPVWCMQPQPWPRLTLCSKMTRNCPKVMSGSPIHGLSIIEREHHPIINNYFFRGFLRNHLKMSHSLCLLSTHLLSDYLKVS